MGKVTSFSTFFQPMEEEAPHGLGILTCAVFIVGEIAGSGVLALPSAVENAGECRSQHTQKLLMIKVLM